MRFEYYTTFYGKTYEVGILEDSSIILISENSSEIENGFEEKYPGRFIKTVSRSDIGQIYSVHNYCTYKGYDFGIRTEKDNKVLLVCSNHELYKSKVLKLEMADRDMYQIWVDKDDLDKTWEEITVISDF